MTSHLSIAAGGLVYCDLAGPRRVLLLRRHDGFWVLPKGHTQPSDGSIEATALREVTEESGVPTKLLKIERAFAPYRDDSQEAAGESKVVHVLLMRYLGENLSSLTPDADHAEAQWWPLSVSFSRIYALFYRKFVWCVITKAQFRWAFCLVKIS